MAGETPGFEGTEPDTGCAVGADDVGTDIGLGKRAEPRDHPTPGCPDRHDERHQTDPCALDPAVIGPRVDPKIIGDQCLDRCRLDRRVEEREVEPPHPHDLPGDRDRGLGRMECHGSILADLAAHLTVGTDAFYDPAMPRRPLSGIRVVDLTIERGELAGRLLSDLGAEVLRIEPPEGSPARGMHPMTGGQSLFFTVRNAGKLGVVLNLGQDPDRDRFCTSCWLAATW